MKPPKLKNAEVYAKLCQCTSPDYHPMQGHIAECPFRKADAAQRILKDIADSHPESFDSPVLSAVRRTVRQIANCEGCGEPMKRLDLDKVKGRYLCPKCVLKEPLDTCVCGSSVLDLPAHLKEHGCGTATNLKLLDDAVTQIAGIFKHVLLNWKGKP